MFYSIWLVFSFLHGTDVDHKRRLIKDLGARATSVQYYGGAALPLKIMRKKTFWLNKSQAPKN